MNAHTSVVVVLSVMALSVMLAGRGDTGKRAQAVSPGANGGDMLLEPCTFNTQKRAITPPTAAR